MHCMRLRLETDYAIRSVLYLAQQNDYVTALKIAQTMEIPEKVIPRVLSRLNRAQLVISHVGVAGGHKLSRPASQITLFEVMSCMDDQIALRPRRKPQGLAANELLKGADNCLFVLQDAIEHTLRQYTIEDVLHSAPPCTFPSVLFRVS